MVKEVAYGEGGCVLILGGGESWHATKKLSNLILKVRPCIQSLRVQFYWMWV